MRPRSARSAGEARQIRVASLVSFLATVVLVVALSLAHSAQAAAPGASPAAGPLAAFDLGAWEEDEEEAWEDEEAEEGCEEFEEEELEPELEEEWCEEGEEGEDLEAEEASECILTGAVARVAALRKQRRLDLVVRYRAERPAAVTIRWSLRGRRGRLGLGVERARFSRAGSFRHREPLPGRKRLRKALAAREFRVTVRAVNTPAHCRAEFDLRLRARHTGRAGPTWSERR